MPVSSDPIELTAPPSGLSDNNADIIALERGFMVGFNRYNGATFNTTLMAQRYDANGEALGRAITIDDGSFHGSGGPELVYLGNNKAGVFWLGRNDETGSTSFYAAKMDVRNGNITGQKVIAEAPGSDQHEAVLLSNGNVALFTEQWLGISKVLTLTTLNGNLAVTKQQAVNEATIQSWPTFDHSISALEAGGGVVAYRDDANDQVFARVFANNGALRKEAQVNTTAVADQFVSDTIAMRVETAGLSGGGYVVVWTSLESTPGSEHFEIRARVFNENGRALGSDFLVNETLAGSAQEPHVLAKEDGGFIVQWTNVETLQPTMYAREFSARGRATSGETVTQDGFFISTAAPDSESAIMSNGQVVTVWSGSTNFGITGDGFFARDLGAPPAAPEMDLWAEAGVADWSHGLVG